MPLREGRLQLLNAVIREIAHFYSRPYARGDLLTFFHILVPDLFLLAPLREGRRDLFFFLRKIKRLFLLAPLREGRHLRMLCMLICENFYSRPYARGDRSRPPRLGRRGPISTRAPTRGATRGAHDTLPPCSAFLLAPLREGRRQGCRPGGTCLPLFLLAPLREGRRASSWFPGRELLHFYSRPYARGDSNFSQNHKLIYMINC